MFGFDYWKLFAGLGIFLFGMQLLEQSVKDLSGKAFRRIIRNYTNTRIKSIANGALVTAVLQSSSAVSLMVLAFVGAGIMNMENAIGVILGSNIGTTLTAWIVATLGFKVKIETFALPFIGIGALGLILFKPNTRLYHLNRLFIGFGFLFLGLDYMKTSVEHFSKDFDPKMLENLALWAYLLIGTLLTALMQASAATIAITLAALNSGLMNFEMAAVMVIGANIGTTVTVLLGAIGGTPPKKRVAGSHLIFNLVTGITAFLGLPVMIMGVEVMVDITTNGPVGLAIFHTLFNLLGVLIFLPMVSTMTALLTRFVPDHKAVLSVYINNTPTEETYAAGVALRNEVFHLLQEAQLYTLRILHLDSRLVFEKKLPFEKKKRLASGDLYTCIKQLHSAVISYYSKIQTQTLVEAKTNELERVILASRNIMNAAKNFESIRASLDEFEMSDALYMNIQCDRFRNRMIALLKGLEPINATVAPEEKYQIIIKVFQQIQQEDDQFITDTVKASSQDTSGQMDLSSLFLVNRLFTQACRMMVFSLKDLLLSQEQALAFDKAREG